MSGWSKQIILSSIQSSLMSQLCFVFFSPTFLGTVYHIVSLTFIYIYRSSWYNSQNTYIFHFHGANLISRHIFSCFMNTEIVWLHSNMRKNVKLNSGIFDIFQFFSRWLILVKYILIFSLKLEIRSIPFPKWTILIEFLAAIAAL